MATKIELTDENGNRVIHLIEGNVFKGYIIKDGQMYKKCSYQDDDNSVNTVTQEPKNSIFSSIVYNIQRLINKLLNK